MRRLHGSRQGARLQGLRRRRQGAGSRTVDRRPQTTRARTWKVFADKLKSLNGPAMSLVRRLGRTVETRLFRKLAALFGANYLAFSRSILRRVRSRAAVIGRVLQSIRARLAPPLPWWRGKVETVTAFAANSAAGIWSRLCRWLRIPAQNRLPDLPGGDPVTFGVVAGGILIVAALTVTFAIDYARKMPEPLETATVKRAGPVRPPVRPLAVPQPVKPDYAGDLEAEVDTQWVYAGEESFDAADVTGSEAVPQPLDEGENLAVASPLLVRPEARPDNLIVPGPDVALLPIEPEPAPGAAITMPPWLANAVPVRRAGKGPMIAIVIDDAGVARERTARAIELPAPLTIAFIPYSGDLARQAHEAQRRGHELLLHIPMEPESAAADPGPNALLTSMDNRELMRRLRWAMARFDGFVGINNHMGSKFMARADLLEPLLAEMNDRGYLFLDSRTEHTTVGASLARKIGMPHASRDVFLDNELDADKIAAQLARLERVARRKGHAIAIGHPHDVTVEMLAEWIPRARARGFNLVPVSAIVKLEYGEDARLAAAAGRGETNGLLGSPQ